MPPSGYAWWYFDGVSDDRSLGIAIIGFVGSVFSPYYFSARKRNIAADPMNHCAFNVAVYKAGGNRWTFCERPSKEVDRNAAALTIGKSRISAEKPGEIQIDIDEESPVFKRPVKGSVRLSYDHLNQTSFFLDKERRHLWHPIVPRAKVEVTLRSPSIHFVGSGYHDMNRGDAPLESAFIEWQWSRHILSDQTAVFYDGTYVDNTKFTIAAAIDDSGAVHEIESVPGEAALSDTRIWKCPRTIRSESTPRVLVTLENSPFYARSLVETTVCAESVTAVHESLRLDRFVKRATQLMLPFRLRKNK